MKKSAQNRIIIWSIVSVLVIGILVSSLAFIAHTRIMPSIHRLVNEDHYNTVEYTYDTAYKLAYNTDEVSDININLCNGKVIVKGSDSDQIEINQFGSSTSDEPDMFFYEYYPDGGSLTIYGGKSDFDLKNQDFSSSDFTLAFENFFRHAQSKIIVIGIPYSLYPMDFIQVNTASADTEINNINTNNLTINSFSGDVSADSTKSSYMTVQNVSGNIDLNNVGVSTLSLSNISGDADVSGNIETIDFDCVSGNLNYSADSLDTYSISANTVSGDTNIKLPENSGFTVINSSLSGELKSGFNGRIVDDQYIYGDGSTIIELNSVSGSVSINPLKDDKSEQAKAEQKQEEKQKASTSATSSTSQTQPTTTKATKSDD